MPGVVPGRRGSERSSPAMCWRRASSRCVESTSPMARRSRGRIRSPLLRRTPLAPWSPQAPLPPPRSPAAARAPLGSHRGPRCVPPASGKSLSTRRPGPCARPAPPLPALPSQATPPRGHAFLSTPGRAGTSRQRVDLDKEKIPGRETRGRRAGCAPTSDSSEEKADEGIAENWAPWGLRPQCLPLPSSRRGERRDCKRTPGRTCGKSAFLQLLSF